MPSSYIAKSINHTLGQWHIIINCFQDGDLELDTTGCEAIDQNSHMSRSTGLGMKNHSRVRLRQACWMFSGRAEAGTSKALISKLLANCQVQGLDPEGYFIEVLKRFTGAAPRGGI